MPASSNSWAHLETLSHWQCYLKTKRVLTAVLTIFVGSVNTTTTTTTTMITSVGHFFFSFSSFSFSSRQALVHPISNIISSSPCRQQRHNRYQFAHCCRVVVHCTSSNRIMHMQLAHRTLSSRWPSSIEPLSCVCVCVGVVHLLTIIVVASEGVGARAIITD